MSVYMYPADIVEPLKAQWYEWYRRETEIPDLPSDAHLRLMLEVAYHASFTADEQRRARFRLVNCLPEESLRPLRVEPSRELAPHEIMRLAPVAGATDAMLGVAVVDGAPRIWGLCDESFMHLVISASGPGNLHVGRNQRVLVALEAGRFSDGYSKPGVFQAVIDSLADTNAALWEGVDWPGGSWSPEIAVLPGQLYEALGAIRTAGHGGTVLMVPDDDWHERPWDRILHVKYGCDDNALWPLLRASVRQYDSKVMATPQEAQASAAESEARVLMSRIAGLSAIDGAVLITDRLRVLGFGVEVLAPPTVATVKVPEGTSREVTAYGTRHRSAFRFCQAYPRGTAFVCSQDGGIKCVRNQGGRVVVWE